MTKKYMAELVGGPLCGQKLVIGEESATEIYFPVFVKYPKICESGTASVPTIPQLVYRYDGRCKDGSSRFLYAGRGT